LIDYCLYAVVYSCTAMSDADCSKCLSLDYYQETKRFNCRWCQNGCQSQVTCAGSALKTCPPPTISNVRFTLMFIHQ